MPLKAEGISKRSNLDWTLKDISFETGPGEILGIFGPSGSGKGMLLRILAGSEKPNGGRFLLDSADLFEFTASNRGVHYAGPPLNSHSPRLLDKLFNKRVPRSETEIITEALSSDAMILFFDDPLCRFGAEQKETEFGRIRDAARETGKYIVYATANYDDVLRLCDNVAVISNGEVLQTGTPEDVYLHPATATVAALTGQCNIFEARRLSSSKADVPEFQTITGSHRLIAGKTDKARLGPLNRNITLAVRPEHISISFGASFPEDNLLKAVVTGARFLGPITLVELDAGGLKMNALVMRLVGLKPGDECMIGVPRDRIMIFAH